MPPHSRSFQKDLLGAGRRWRQLNGGRTSAGAGRQDARRTQGTPHPVESKSIHSFIRYSGISGICACAALGVGHRPGLPRATLSQYGLQRVLGGPEEGWGLGLSQKAFQSSWHFCTILTSGVQRRVLYGRDCMCKRPETGSGGGGERNEQHCVRKGAGVSMRADPP